MNRVSRHRVGLAEEKQGWSYISQNPRDQTKGHQEQRVELSFESEHHAERYVLPKTGVASSVTAVFELGTK